MQTERVTYLTNAEQKAALEAFAKARGESVGSVLREAAAQYIAEPNYSEARELEELVAIIADVAEAVPEMQASLKRSADMLEQSRIDLDRKLRDAGIRK